MLDIFKNDAFKTTSLTEKILKAPYKPGRIGSLKLFREKGIRNTSVVVEEKDGQLTLIQSSPRGGPGSNLGGVKRKARAFIVPHLERNSKVMADEVQDVRAFGSEDELEGVSTVVAERLSELRAMHEATLEYMRAGAIQGIVKDADGTTLVDLFTEFGVAQQTHEFTLTDVAFDVRNACIAVQRLSEAELGAEPVSGYRAFCGDAFFDALIAHAKVVGSLQYQESKTLREDLRKGFEYGGIVWENYRGSVNGTAFFPAAEAFVFPEGTGIFSTNFAPADFKETVNTIGLPIYAKVEEGEMDRWDNIHTQSNPLALCLRPRAVIKITKA